MRYSKIVGLGHHVPETIITNEYLSGIMDTNDEWIVERTGIKERRYIDPAKDTVANMAAKATRIALERAHLKTPVETSVNALWPSRRACWMSTSGGSAPKVEATAFRRDLRLTKGCPGFA